MKIINKNLKQAVLQVQTQSLDDVWLIYRIVQPGDEISGFTERKIKVGDSTSEKASAVSIKKMNLTITVEKINYETDGKTVRILGPIKTGNDFVSAGEYHSFSIDESTTIAIQKKQWHAHQIRTLEESTHGGKGTTLIVAYDRSSATIGSIATKGFTKITNLDGQVQKKGMDSQSKEKESFYGQIVSQIKAIDERLKPTTIVLASSNFWREPLFAQIDNTAKELRKKTKWIECDEISEQAINQLVATKEFQQLTLGESQAKIYNDFDEILKRIGTDGAVTYGIEEVKKATAQGAVQQVLVSQTLLHTMREKETFNIIEALLLQIEQQGGIVHIVGDEFTILSKLDGIGGIAALLRFKLE